MSLLYRSVRILRTEGISTLLRRGTYEAYRQTREVLPRTTATYGGVEVRAGRILDDYVPDFSLDRPGYESGLTAAIEGEVEEGDRVVIVGGGWGVTAVLAARRVGPEGSVTVYEGSKTQLERVRETLALNGVSGRVTVEHAVVGADVSVFGSAGDADFVPSAELPDCDVLSLDCEGAELRILDGYEGEPRAVFVETHAFLGAPKADVEERLTGLGYTIDDVRVAEETSREYCEEKGIYVVTATRAGA
ncbi:FkbM family methyltransferase [Halarchaeum sp. CBA1220]|uniref:FkbM family methyltransferase n=1 Tax=Halarchaeum sp. CBA1220 TaxID=1853682 RepID=UPI000F3A9F32|nr:FkbM family methyltransferase [Halarchaeum sp. CBA1220]QLC34412.1 FkbM family methyltransferase [Halarchaeum sp. CBA1220]